MSDESEDLTARAEAVKERAQKLNNTEPEFSKGETIFMVGFFGAMIAGVAALFWAGVKEQERQEEEYQLRVEDKRRDKEAFESWLNESENEGYKIYKLDDGRLLTVDGTASQQTHIKREVIDTIRNRNVV